MDHNVYSLISAAVEGNETLVSHLISKGADLNGKSNSGNKAIRCAATYGQTKIIELLLDTGLVSVNCRGPKSQTPLHCAVHNKNLATIEFLVSKNADCNARNIFGETPLYIAFDRYRVCGCSGNNCVLNFNTDSSAIHYYLNTLPDSIKRKCYFLAIAAFLITETNADFIITDDSRKNPLDVVSEYCQLLNECSPFVNHSVAVKQYFIELSVKLKNIAALSGSEMFRNYLSPLHLAIKKSNFSAIELLVKNNAEVNAVDEKLQTPLHHTFQKFNDCCHAKLDNVCICIEAMKEASTISEIYHTIDDLPYRCAFIALAVYLITAGNANLSMVDDYGIKPVEMIKNEVVRSNADMYFNQLSVGNIQFSETELITEKDIVHNHNITQKNAVQEVFEMHSLKELNASVTQMTQEVNSIKLFTPKCIDKCTMQLNEKDVEMGNILSDINYLKISIEKPTNESQSFKTVKNRRMCDIKKLLSEKDKVIEQLLSTIQVMNSSIMRLTGVCEEKDKLLYQSEQNIAQLKAKIDEMQTLILEKDTLLYSLKTSTE